jgi:hypothetical protein
MSETIVRSSPYRRSDCITIVCLLELKSAAQRYLFVVCLLTAALLLALATVRCISGVGLDVGGGPPKLCFVVRRKGPPQITWPLHRSIPTPELPAVAMLRKAD